MILAHLRIFASKMTSSSLAKSGLVKRAINKLFIVANQIVMVVHGLEMCWHHYAATFELGLLEN